MKDLDLSTGKSLLEDLCDTCKMKLQKAITRTDVLRAVTPRGLKKLFKKISLHVCEDCDRKILEAGLRK